MTALATNMADFTPPTIPLRHCASGAKCVTFSVGLLVSTVLCRYNPGPLCYACQQRERKANVAHLPQRPHSGAEIVDLMRNAKAVAA